MSKDLYEVYVAYDKQGNPLYVGRELYWLGSTDWGVLIGECSLLITVSVGCVLSLYRHSTLTSSNKPTPPTDISQIVGKTEINLKKFRTFQELRLLEFYSKTTKTLKNFSWRQRKHFKFIFKLQENSVKSFKNSLSRHHTSNMPLGSSHSSATPR